MNKEKILDMITKLKNLTESPNEHESALALQKMQKMIDKYNVTPEMLKKLKTNDIKIVRTSWTHPREVKLKDWEIYLGQAIATYFDASALIAYKLDKNYRQKRNTLFFIGIEEDTIAAKEMFSWIHKSIVQQAVDSSYVELDLLKKQYGSNWRDYSDFNTLSHRTTFGLGASYGLGDKLNKAKEERKAEFTKSNNNTALIIIDEKLALIKKETSKYKTIKSKPSISDVKAFMKGQVLGEKLCVDKQIN